MEDKNKLDIFSDPQNKPLIGVFVLLSFIFILWMVSILFTENNRNSKPHELAVAEDIVFKDTKIDAVSAIVFDVSQQKIIFEKNPDQILPIASITKVMSALVIKESGIADKTIITRDSVRMDGDSGLIVGESWQTDRLVDFSLITSSNDGTRALASAVGSFSKDSLDSARPEDIFVNKMNEKAYDLGLSSLRFYNDTGLDINKDLPGAFGSARDIAKLFAYIVETDMELLSATRYESLDISSENLIHKAVNTNQITGDLPEMIGGKTGFTDLSGGNLAVVFDAGIQRPIVIVVLGSGTKERFEDVSQLARKSLDYIMLETNK